MVIAGVTAFLAKSPCTITRELPDSTCNTCPLQPPARRVQRDGDESLEPRPQRQAPREWPQAAQGRVRLALRKDFCAEGAVGRWNGLPRAGGESPSLEGCPQRLKQELFHRHKEAQQCCRPHNLPLLRAAQHREMEAVEQRIREEQRMMDEKIVLELDQKVIDQQSTLEKAGVSGFYITTNPQELTLQMNLLELIRKLQQKESESEKAFS
uniref:Protein DGCR6 n=1 Tax=Athene cunicularia TaxID=194338 RepID=A0A663LWW3_ATHCN